MMTPRKSWIFLILPVFGIALWWSFSTSASTPVIESFTPELRPSGAPSPVPFLGLNGCAARACHGDPTPKNISSPNAYITWARSDPHANAFKTLQNPKSKTIALKLAQGDEKKVIPPTKDVRCLACHVLPQSAELKDDFALAIHKEGVSCESCHGAANDWNTPHRAWKPNENRKPLYEKSKMTWLNDPAGKVQVCVGCHVGAPANPEQGIPLRDVNHELIAAGHPRLMFDFATYMRKMPRHWQEIDRTLQLKEKKETPIEHWWVGIKYSLLASLDLLEARSRIESSWPEFAEHDCYVCHGNQIRRPLEQGQSRPNQTIIWNRWQWSDVAQHAWADPELERSRQSLTTIMHQKIPSSRMVIELTASSRKLLRNLSDTPPKSDKLQGFLTKNLREDRFLSDDAFSWHNAFSAFIFTNYPKKEDNPKAYESLEDLQEILPKNACLPLPEFDSPKAKGCIRALQELMK